MATVIDALVVTLGLDPSAFTKGQKQAATAFLKTRQAAEREGKQVERSLDGASEAIERLARNALKLAAIFTGGRALGTFATDIGKADAAMGRMADRLGVAPERIAAFDNAVKRAGGTAGEGSASFQRLSDTINELRTNGSSSALVPFARLQGISGQQIRLNGKLEESFGDLAEAAKGTADKAGASTASFLLRQAGYSETTINLLLKGRKAVEQALTRSQKAGLVSKADSDAARNLGEQYEDLSDRVTDFGRKISTALTPVLTDLMKRFADWLDLNKDWLKDDIVGEVTKFATELRKIPWDDVGKGIKEFIKGANDGAQAIGGWTRVAEIFFGLWALDKVGTVLANIALIRRALVIGDTSLLAAMARVGIPVAIGAAAMGHGFQTPEQAAKDPDQAQLQREGIDRRGRVREWIGDRYDDVRRFGRRLLGRPDEGPQDGIHRRTRRFDGKSPPGSIGAGGKAHQSENAKAVMEEFMKAGLPAEGVAALMGSAQTESRFNPRAHNDISGGHDGLLQWDRHRWPKIVQWIKDRGGDPYDARWQARAAIAEGRAKPGEAMYDHPRTARGWRTLQGAAGDLPGAMGGIRDIERYGPNEEAGRGANARAWLPKVNDAAAERAKDVQIIQGAVSGARKPEILADPKDERRKPMASLFYGDTPPAARAGAASVVAQTASIASDRAAATMNDNRSTNTSTSSAHFHGDMVFNGVKDSADVERNLRARLKEPQFVQAVNYGQA